MRLRIELKPTEPLVATIVIPDEQLSPERRKKIVEAIEMVDRTGLCLLDDLPAEMTECIEWYDVISVHFEVKEIEVVPEPHGRKTA